MAASAVKAEQKTRDEEFEELFREHSQFIYRAAYSVTGNKADAKDVVQTIFLRLLGHEFQEEIRKNPRGYLYQAAINESLHVLRSRKRQKLTPILEKNKECDEVVQKATSSHREEGARQRLRDAIAQLEPEAVEILILHYEQGYTDAQIAEMRGQTRGTVASTLHRIRATLKKLMTEETS